MWYPVEGQHLEKKNAKREAYGILLIVIGVALVSFLKPAGLGAMLVGTGMIGLGFLRPRIHY